MGSGKKRVGSDWRWKVLSVRQAWFDAICGQRANALSDGKSPGWPPYTAVYHMLLCDADKGLGDRYIKGKVHVLDDDDKFYSDGNEFFLKECTPWW
jgi:hypothetical protein